MAEDREVLRVVWGGRIPVRLNLAPDEVYRMQEPDPYHMMIPRITYFPLVMDKVSRLFSRYVEEKYQKNEMWLEFDGQPLKWHYPFGHLYDLYAGLDADLPWSLTVHFQNFPEDELLHCPSRPAVESHFMSMIKEADALKHRGQVISFMQKKDHTQLWLGLQNDKFEQFWAVNNKLMEHSGEDGYFKYIPFRIYQPEKPVIQKLMRPVNDSGEKAILEDLIRMVVPEALDEETKDKYRIVSHGIELPLDTPLQWLSEHLSYPDNFLHVCILSDS